MDEKYIKLLLEKCLNFKKSKSLFISLEQSVNKEFGEKLVIYAHKLGINDIYIHDKNLIAKHELLKTIKIEDIENNSIFSDSIFDTYAKKNANFLMIESEIPDLMKDIDPDKIAKMGFIARKTKPIFREKEVNDLIPWCICAYPNEKWAQEIFPNDKCAYQKLYNSIMKMCMVDTKDPCKSWDEYITNSVARINKLNNLGIKKLHYSNSLGTDLFIEMPNDSLWCGAANNKDMIVNMPSYEIFSSPNYLKTNGIVYNSKPLFYSGKKIDGFWIKFRDGKVIDFDAKEGKEILKGIINSDSNSCYLGEVSLVNNDSPISNTHLVFGTTLIDENAACHLALGDGFSECIKDGDKLNKEELLEHGINKSTNHVDFMIGTGDLLIEIETEKGNMVLFEKGNFKDM